MLNSFKRTRRRDSDADPLAIRSLLDDPQLRELMGITDDVEHPAADGGRFGRRHRAS